MNMNMIMNMNMKFRKKPQAMLHQKLYERLMLTRINKEKLSLLL